MVIRVCDFFLNGNAVMCWLYTMHW